MKNSEEIHFHNLLKAEIEKIALRKIALKRDFEYLSAHIMDRTGAYISPITLRRFWGETDGVYNVQPRRYTLDSLARYAGHSSYEQFVHHCTGGGRTDSDFIIGEYLVPGTLKKGDSVAYCLGAGALYNCRVHWLRDVLHSGEFQKQAEQRRHIPGRYLGPV